MKLLQTEMQGLLRKPAPSVPPEKSRASTTLCGRDIARTNELKCLQAVAQFGHLRITELARAVWPTSRYAEQVARRTSARLIGQGLLLARRNALGSRSLCLTRVGAAWLDARGFEAQHTLDLSSVAGSTFFHRTLATRYLVERQNEGFQVAGEYQILRRKTPFPLDGLITALRKLPDGLVWRRGPAGQVDVELIEQEAAAKARPELEKCLRAAEFAGYAMDNARVYRVSGLVFVYDRELNHARRILLAATSLWGNRPHDERVTLEQRVKLAAVELRDPLVWVSSHVTTLHDLRLTNV